MPTEPGRGCQVSLKVRLIAAVLALGLWSVADAGVVALVTNDASAPVVQRFDYLGAIVGLGDDGLIAVTDVSGISLTDGRALVSYGDLVPGFGRLIQFGAPVINVHDDIAFLGYGTAGGILLASGGTILPIVRAGDRAPDGSTINGVVELSFNDHGAIAFRANTTLNFGMYAVENGVVRKVAVVGDPAPDGGTYQQLGGWDEANRPIISNNGETVFKARTTRSAGIFAVRPDGTGRVVVKVGDPLPGGQQVGLFSSTGVGMGGRVDINSAGDVAFFAGSPFRCDFGLYLSSGGTIQQVVAIGDAAPGGGTFSGFGGCNAESVLALNDAGDVLFAAAIGLNNRFGFFVASGGTIRKVVEVGDVIPGAGSVWLGFPPAVPSFSSTGAAALAAYVNNQRAVIFAQPDGTLSVLARRGDPAPTRPVYRSFDMAKGGFNAAGTVAFEAPVGGGGIFTATEAGVEAVAQVGDPAPGGGTFTGFAEYYPHPPTVNAGGAVAFIAEFSDGDPEKDGIFAGPPGALQRIAAAGNPSPTGGTLAYFQDPPVIDDVGGVTFIAYLNPDFSQGVFRSLNGTLTTLATNQRGVSPLPPNFLRVGYFIGVDSNAAGDVAFSAIRTGLNGVWQVRNGGRPKRLVSGRKHSPFAAVGGVALNAHGLVAFGAGGYYADDVFTAVRPVIGRTQVSPVANDTGVLEQDPDLNDRDEVFYFDGGYNPSRIIRWQEGSAQPVIQVGDATPVGKLRYFGYPQTFAANNNSELVFVGQPEDPDGFRQAIFKVSP